MLSQVCDMTFGFFLTISILNQYDNATQNIVEYQTH